MHTIKAVMAATHGITGRIIMDILYDKDTIYSRMLGTKMGGSKPSIFVKRTDSHPI